MDRLRVLVFGGTGMLGHVLCRELSGFVETFATVRSTAADALPPGLVSAENIIAGIRAENGTDIERAMAAAQPHVVVNCVGIVKQSAEALDPVRSIAVNALFPHVLARMCSERNVRLVHISTDCVFSGRTGNYSEQDVPDPLDLYGRSKLLGEVAGTGTVTLRTSMIGRELRGAYGLVEWFLSRAGEQVQGYTRAIFSGLTTPALARVIRHVVVDHPNLTGLYHVAAEPIDKYRLLDLIESALRTGSRIIQDPSVVIDRSLDAGKFERETGLVAPSWPDMIDELAQQSAFYTAFRGSYGFAG